MVGGDDDEKSQEMLFILFGGSDDDDNFTQLRFCGKVIDDLFIDDFTQQRW